MHGAGAAERHAYMFALPVHAWSTANRQAQPHALMHAVDHPAAHLTLTVVEVRCNGDQRNHIECLRRGVARMSSVERGAQGAASVTSSAIVAPRPGVTASCSRLLGEHHEPRQLPYRAGQLRLARSGGLEK